MKMKRIGRDERGSFAVATSKKYPGKPKRMRNRLTVPESLIHCSLISLAANISIGAELTSKMNAKYFAVK